MSHPAFLDLTASGELEARTGQALARLGACDLCPRLCRADRLGGEFGFCATGRQAKLASAGPHFGEEDVLVGRRGSGTIFVASCNLGCDFCQNAEISRERVGREVTASEWAQVMLELQARGCHNINIVTPSHVVPALLEALCVAARGGLRLPIVYNTSAYDLPETLRLLAGVIDIYMARLQVLGSAGLRAIRGRPRLRRARPGGAARDAPPDGRPRPRRGGAGATGPARAPPGPAGRPCRDASGVRVSRPGDLA